MEGISRAESPAKLSLPLLPTEVRGLILSHLPDFPSLRGAIFSHSCLNGAFAENKAYIIKCVVISYVSPELLPVALSVLESSRIKPWTREKVLELLDRHHNPYVCPPYQMNIHDALCLEKMHSNVVFFTRRFAVFAVTKHPLTGDPDSSPSPITTNEWHRMAYNFYLFELYAELFRERYNPYDKNAKSSPGFNFDEQRDLNKKRHSFWEIEQQTCIYEYLYRELSRVYNDTATHDVRYGIDDFQGDYADREAWEQGNNSLKPYFLLYGLEFLRSFVSADTFEERYRLFHLPPIDIPGQRDITLKWQRGDPRGKGARLKEYTPEEVETKLGPSFLPHLEHGPKEAWMWAYASVIDTEFGYNYQARELRARGYVLWDYDRLVNWGLFQSEFVPPDDNDEDLREREHVMERGRARKRKLAKMNAGGWWSEDDESHLTWEGYRIADISWRLLEHTTSSP